MTIIFTKPSPRKNLTFNLANLGLDFHARIRSFQRKKGDGVERFLSMENFNRPEPFVDAMGSSCIRSMERVFASSGKENGTETRFEACVDDVNAGGI